MDFVQIISQLTNFIQNEHVSAYNEGVDMMLKNVKDWMIFHGITPKSNNIPSLLDEIERHYKICYGHNEG